MAIDKSTLERGSHAFILTTDAVANVLTRVDLPSWCSSIVVRPRTNESRYALTGTDGAAIGADYFTLTGDAAREFVLRPGPARPATWPMSVYLTSPTGATEIEVELHESIGSEGFVNVYPRAVPLTAAGFNQYQATNWAFSNPTTTTLRATYSGAGTTKWDSSGQSACILIWPYALIRSSDDHLYRSLVTWLRFTHPTANGIGVGVGVGQHITAPTQGAYVMADRVDATNVRIQLNGENAAAAVLSASTANTFGLKHKIQTVKSNRGDFNGGMYTVSTGVFHSDTLIGEKGGGISGMGGGDNMYLCICLFSGGNAGYVDITGLAYSGANFRGGHGGF